MTFVKVAETSEIPLGQMKAVKLAESDVLIANVNGTYYAIDSICTHKSGDLSKGTLEGNTVTCSKHKAKFDVTTGKVISGPSARAMVRLRAEKNQHGNAYIALLPFLTPVCSSYFLL